MNRLRRARGCPSSRCLRRSRAAAAHIRAPGAAGQFTHDWTDETPFATWIQRYLPAPRTGTWLAGENLVWSATTHHAIVVAADFGTASTRA